MGAAGSLRAAAVAAGSGSGDIPDTEQACSDERIYEIFVIFVHR